MTALFLYGFDDPESQLLLQGLLHEEASLEPIDLDAFEDDCGEKPDGVALIWGLGKTVAYSASISNRVAARGMPVVAILDVAATRGFDFHAGFLELCFNPHSVKETLARISIARSRADVNSSPVIVHGDLAIDINSFVVTMGEKNIELTYKEYELLKLFASNPGRVFRREEILNRIWGDDYYGGTRTVDVHVRRLRSKLDDLSHTIIETMWRVGYRFRNSETRTPPNSRMSERAS